MVHASRCGGRTIVLRKSISDILVVVIGSQIDSDVSAQGQSPDFQTDNSVVEIALAKALNVNFIIG
eukprot:m.416185 g.416185  ORF g.416185 m.416185 type:complete len:66 (+) comp16829_c1_seq22:1178-1375(+)